MRYTAAQLRLWMMLVNERTRVRRVPVQSLLFGLTLSVYRVIVWSGSCTDSRESSRNSRVEGQHRGVKAGMTKLHTAAVRRDEYVDKEMEKQHERLVRHRHEIETMRGRISVLEEETLRSAR